MLKKRELTDEEISETLGGTLGGKTKFDKAIE